MHFHSLAVLRIPQVEEDLEATAKVASKLASLERMEQIGPENIMRQVFIRELKEADRIVRLFFMCIRQINVFSLCKNTLPGV